MLKNCYKILVEIPKSSSLSDELFGVDRGGVEPHEQGDDPAPETARTRPSDPQCKFSNSANQKTRALKKGSWSYERSRS